MAYADDILERARHLANRERRRPRQASLRRAVSTAYYALFHLLISEATLNRKRVDERTVLARFFEHGKMKTALDRQRGECNRFMNATPPRTVGLVSRTRVPRRSNRGTRPTTIMPRWERAEALALISQVESAFEGWRAIRDEPAAHAYLISLLGNPEGI